MKISSNSPKLLLAFMVLAFQEASGAELPPAKDMNQSRSQHVAPTLVIEENGSTSQLPSKWLQQEQPITASPYNGKTLANRSQYQPIRQQQHHQQATQTATGTGGGQEDELNTMGQKVMVSTHSAALSASNEVSERQAAQAAVVQAAAATGGRSNGHQREPLQHIDPAAAAAMAMAMATSSASKHSTLGSSVRQFNGTYLERQQSMRQTSQPEFNVGAIDPNASNESVPPGRLPVRELHFGAKVALSILMAVILLVAGATFVDLNSSATIGSPGEQMGANLLHHNQQQQQRQQQQQLMHLHLKADKQQQQQQLQAVGQREQRSPSLSSSSSSTLFSSANSLSSASAPILSRNNGHHHHQHHHQHHNQQHHHQQNSNTSSQSNECPTLGHDIPRAQQHGAWFRRVGCQLAQSCSKSGQQYFSHNLQFNSMVLQQQEQQEGLGCSTNEPVTALRIQKQPEESLMDLASAHKAPKGQPRWPGELTSSDELHQTQTIRSQALAPCANHDKYEKRKQLARQVFLSFSLRHSASLIFETNSSSSSSSSSRRRPEVAADTAEQRKYTCAHQTSPLSACQINGSSSSIRPQQLHYGACVHRSRVSSLSSVNEVPANSHQLQSECCSDDTSSSDVVCCELDTCCSLLQQDSTQATATAAITICDSARAKLLQRQPLQPELEKNFPSARIESINSLHGLRFLSMIWIIVIHSYSFALRWLFFTNSPTLDNIYKTAASQLLANGTFACDSFFFAGGFLLPYLAFPAYKPPTSELDSNQNNYQHQQSTCSQATSQYRSSSSLGPSRSPSTVAAAGREANITETKNGRLDGESRQQQQLSKQDSSSAATRSACSSPEIQNQQEDSLSSSGSYDSRQSPASFHQHSGPQTSQQSNNNQIINNHKLSCCTPATTTAKTARHFQHQPHLNTNKFTLKQVVGNILHRYIRMMPLMMAIIGLSASLLRYMGEGPVWDDSTMMFDKWCRKNWWINALFLHNFLNRENMCLGHSWYSAVDIQLFLIGQLIMFILFRSKRLGLLLCCTFLIGAQLITGALTLIHHLPAVPLIASVSEQSMNLYYGEIYIKPYCRSSPYLIGILLAYLMRTTAFGQIRLDKWQVATGWTASIGTLVAILMAMQPAMNGQVPSELQSALYSSLSRPLWACATGWMIFACMTKHGGIFATILGARCFIPLSRLTYPAFLIHPIVMAVFYGSRQSSYQFSHYLMLYLILGNIVITYAIAFLLSALFELPLLSVERAIKCAWYQGNPAHRDDTGSLSASNLQRQQQQQQHQQRQSTTCAQVAKDHHHHHQDSCNWIN